VLKPGARFATAVWICLPGTRSLPRSPASSAISSRCRRPIRRLRASSGSRRRANWQRVLEAGGFTGIAVEPRPITLTYASLEEYWQIQTDLAAPLRGAIASLTPGQVEQLKARIFEALAPFADGSTIRLAAVPLCASAVR